MLESEWNDVNSPLLRQQPQRIGMKDKAYGCERARELGDGDDDGQRGHVTAIKRLAHPARVLAKKYVCTDFAFCGDSGGSTQKIHLHF